MGVSLRSLALLNKNAIIKKKINLISGNLKDTKIHSKVNTSHKRQIYNTGFVQMPFYFI